MSKGGEYLFVPEAFQNGCDRCCCLFELWMDGTKSHLAGVVPECTKLFLVTPHSLGAGRFPAVSTDSAAGSVQWTSC